MLSHLEIALIGAGIVAFGAQTFQAVIAQKARIENIAPHTIKWWYALKPLLAAVIVGLCFVPGARGGLFGTLLDVAAIASLGYGTIIGIETGLALNKSISQIKQGIYKGHK